MLGFIPPPLGMRSSDIYTPKLRVLRPALQQWVSCNRKIVHRWEEYEDAPWWYNERASLSVLAGAIWKAGGYAFEEFVGDKRVMKGRRKKFSAGRFDLEFDVSGSLFVAEAKQCWMPSTRSQDHFERVSEAMDAAKRDVRRCAPEGVRRLAIVFGAPYFTEGRRADMDERIERLIHYAYHVDAGALAWFFPSFEDPPNTDGIIYPGAFVWIKEVKR